MWDVRTSRPSAAIVWWAPTSDFNRPLLSTISLPVSSTPASPCYPFWHPALPCPSFRLNLSCVSRPSECPPLFVAGTPTKRQTKNSEYSTSVIAFYLCSNRRWPQLSHHTVFLSTDWKASWDSAFGKLPGGELGERLGPRSMVVGFCVARCQVKLCRPSPGKDLCTSPEMENCADVVVCHQMFRPPFVSLPLSANLSTLITS